MLKKVKTSHRLPSQPSLKNIMDDSKNINRSTELNQLFLPLNREIFELSYLVKSPHYNQDKSYTELVNIIQKYNSQTLQKQNSSSAIKDINSNCKKKLACMRLIYRQLLIMAVMEDWQIKESELPRKIKKWYQNLGQHHSFLQGINLKKRKQNINQRQIEEKIRSSYTSNVFDEINDYVRKQIDFNIASQKDTTFSRKKHLKYKKDVDNVNLPLIYLLTYKREDARLREVRQKEYQQQYFKAMLKNKNHIREKTLLKVKNIYNIKPNLELQKQYQNKSSSTFASQCDFYPVIKRSSFIQKNPLKTKLEQFRSKQNLNRLSLSNINGINLINHKTE